MCENGTICPLGGSPQFIVIFATKFAIVPLSLKRGVFGVVKGQLGGRKRQKVGIGLNLGKNASRKRGQTAKGQMVPFSRGHRGGWEAIEKN